MQLKPEASDALHGLCDGTLGVGVGSVVRRGVLKEMGEVAFVYMESARVNVADVFVVVVVCRGCPSHN